MSSRVWELDPNQPPTCSSSRSYARMMRKGMKKKLCSVSCSQAEQITPPPFSVPVSLENMIQNEIPGLFQFFEINFLVFRIYVQTEEAPKVTCSPISHKIRHPAPSPPPLSLWRLKVWQSEQTFSQKISYLSSFHLNFNFFKNGLQGFISTCLPLVLIGVWKYEMKITA